MGHKVNPIGFRLGVIEGWQSRWYAQRNYKDLLAEDRTLRETVRKRLANASVSKIEIERVAGTNIGVTIHTAKPGIVIGKNGESVERLRQDLGTPVRECGTWRDTIVGADIVDEASCLPEPALLLKTGGSSPALC